MKYIEINIHTTTEGIEPVIAELFNLGITDTVVDDPRDIEALMEKEHDYDWDYLDDEIVALADEEPKVTVYLEFDETNLQRADAVKLAMEQLLQRAKDGAFGVKVDFGSLATEIKVEDDQQWKDNWKEYFKPTKVSNTIVVKPTWEEYNKAEGEKVIEIDPGMAFGTGTHETTSLCIKMMEKYIKEGDSVLDVGCGSGILSIAAALLGSKNVLGVDIDPLAVQVSKENIDLNKVGKTVKSQYGDLTKGIDFKANILVANLMADLVKLLSKDVGKHLYPKGIYISSGILVEKEVEVAEAIRACGFKILEVREDGMWCVIVAEV